MSTNFLVKFTAITVPLAEPCRLGSASKPGRSMMVNSGDRPLSCSAVGRIKSWCTNSECQAYSVMMRTGRR